MWDVRMVLYLYMITTVCGHIKSCRSTTVHTVPGTSTVYPGVLYYTSPAPAFACQSLKIFKALDLIDHLHQSILECVII